MSFLIAIGMSFSFMGIASADTIYIGTGIPVTSKYHKNGANVTGTVSDADKNGLADAREGGSMKNHGDVTNTRDVNWSVLYTDVFKADYQEKLLKKNNNAVNARRSAIEHELMQQADKAFAYVDYYKGHGSKGESAKYTGTTGIAAKGVVYESSADLYGTIANENGGLNNFAASKNAGVITTYGRAHLEELGGYRYNADNTISFINKKSPTEGFIGVKSGIVAFTTGFTIDSKTAEYNYINGTFAAMGELMGIYLNGTLLDMSQYFLSDDMISSGYAYASKYNFELDLNKVQDLIIAGNNNISFMLLGIPLEYVGIESGGASDISFINFSADIYQNQASIVRKAEDENPSTTPEPITLLIFGIGITCIGLRKKFMNKN
jgi:hypothetical protein